MTDTSRPPTVVIAGAGPAGLTAALELLRRSDMHPIVLESDSQVGGISKTVNYRGNRMDLGGHRFFSKSDWVMQWWQEILPIAADQLASGADIDLHYQGQKHSLTAAAVTHSADKVMLVRRRLSRIFHRRRYFDYPLKLNAATIRNMGVAETLSIGMSYAAAQLQRRSPERSLEDFLINRFGERLYRTFFKDYTEKVWGVPCGEISAEWGAQRIKGLSVTKALAHALASPFRGARDTAQRTTETSLIERFLYPRLGPGQMWEEVAAQVSARGGTIHLEHRIVGLERTNGRISAALVRDQRDGSMRSVTCDHFISTMPVSELAAMLQPDDGEVVRIASRLPYRDFMTAGILLNRMRGTASRAGPNGMPPDNWIYIQEPDVKVGRVQVFNNWSPDLVADPATIWLGLEYFCNEHDELWTLSDAAFLDLAAAELVKIGMADRAQITDGTAVRVRKAYPAYFGEYAHFNKVRAFLDTVPNLYPVGRNGMHRYNNQDHSMLSAAAAVTSILGEGAGRADIWDINAEDEYHEEA